MIFDKRKDKRDKRREARLNAREARRQYRLEKRNSRFAEGGVVYPIRFKYNRRILLLTRLRRIK